MWKRALIQRKDLAVGLLSFIKSLTQDEPNSSSNSSSVAVARGRNSLRSEQCQAARGQQARAGNQSHVPEVGASVYDGNRQVRVLGKLLNKGGEGRIYPLSNNGDVLVKIYHPSVLAHERSAMMRNKLMVMTRMSAMHSGPHFAWPRILIHAADGKWLGYAMRRAPGHQLQTLCQPQLIRERIPHWSRREVVTCAASFVRLVQEAHANAIILGDINPGNFLIDPRNCDVYAIDCDSFQVPDGSNVYPCPVGIPMLMPPELLALDYGKTRRTVEQELFAVAIMLFRIFMLGLHPYSRTYGEDPVQNLKSGQCALGKGSGCRLPKGPWYNIWSHLPSYMKELFIRTFRDGHAAPSKRATLEEWAFALHRYHCDMGKGWFDLSLVPQQPKSSAYRGRKPLSANANTILGGRSGSKVRESSRPVRKHGMGRPLQRV